MNTRPLLLLFVLACDGEPDSATIEGADELAGGGEQSVAAGDEEAWPYDVHEWGLLDVAADGSYELAAGPGQPSAVALPSPSTMRPRPRPSPRRKPVLYFHYDGSTPLTVDAQVRVPGQIAEHFPAVPNDGQTLRWRVELSENSGRCDDVAYPTRESSACANAPDGYCELADLRGYETNDGACVGFGGVRYDHLFYRSRAGAIEVPITLEAVDGSVQLANQDLPQGHRAFLLEHVEDGVAASALTIDGPAFVGTFAAPSVDATADVRRELAATLRGGGLSEDEASAFERAWFGELFEGGSTGGAPVVRRAVIFVMPEAHVQAVSELRFEPAPRNVQRVFWMRHEI